MNYYMQVQMGVLVIFVGLAVVIGVIRYFIDRD
jgi:hypothetical protein